MDKTRQPTRGGFGGTLVVLMVFLGVLAHANRLGERGVAIGAGATLPQIEAETRIAVEKLSRAIAYLERIQ